MAKQDEQKPAEIKDAEAHGGETYDLKKDEVVSTAGKCSNCKGEGLTDPLGLRVCQVCEGTGKA